MKMWTGRFKGTIDEAADSFNSSLSFDKRLYKHDIMGSIAHCTMLGERGIIPKEEADKICLTLSDIFYDIKNGKLAVSGAEDIHMFVEEELTKRLGDAGKKLHTGRSRNDQVALDIRLYLRDNIDELKQQLRTLTETVIGLAEQHTDTLMPAYTHMQKAQPTTLAHHLMAYAEMFLRDIDRLGDCFDRVNVMPLGSGACTGTTYPIDRARVAELLDFPAVTQNSLDGVSDRDFAAEYVFCCSLIMTHLSRFNEELIYWATDEFGFVELDDRFSTGSSIMPQKKNPDMSELIRGKTGRVYGDLTAILTVMKGLPLAYNKDMQEDKEAVFDAGDTALACIEIFSALLPSLKFNKDAMLKGAGGGFTAATDCADYLVKKGMPFRDAHSVIGSLVLYCAEYCKKLDELSIEEYKKFSPLFEADIIKIVDVRNLVNARKIAGAPSAKSVNAEIKHAKKVIEKMFKDNK